MYRWMFEQHSSAFKIGWFAALEIAKRQAFGARSKMTAKYFDALELEDECPEWSLKPR